MKIKTKRGARRIRNQRVIDRRFVVTDYEGCSYITAGKLYRVFNLKGHSAKFIKSELGFIAEINLNGTSGHLNHEGTWYHPIR